MGQPSPELVEAITGVTKYFQPEKAKGENFILQYVITGDNGGNWYVAVENQTIAVTEGVSANPTCTITMSPDTYMDLYRGRLNAVAAFMSGKIKVAGDMSVATKFPGMIGM